MSKDLQMLTGGSALLLAAGIGVELECVHLQAVAFRSWLGFMYLVTFGSLVGFTAYVYLLRVTTAAKASTYACVNPIAAVLLGWAFAGEAITARTGVAAGVILAGVAIIASAFPNPAPPSTSADLGRDGHHRVGDAAMESYDR